MRDTLEKKKRSPNYTHREKSLLLAVTADFRQIIEIKKTDSKSVKEKDTTWDRITKIFNFRSKENIRRSNKSLRKLYDNLKNFKKKVLQSQGNHTEDHQEEVAFEVEDEECKEKLLDLISQPVYYLDKRQNENSQSSINTRLLPDSPSSHSHDENVQDNTLELEHSYYALRENQVESVDEEIYNDYRISNIQQKRKFAQDCSELTKIKIALYAKEKESIERQINREEELHELRKRKLLLEIEKAELELRRLRET